MAFEQSVEILPFIPTGSKFYPMTFLNFTNVYIKKNTHAVGKDRVKITKEETLGTKNITKKKMHLKKMAKNDLQTPTETKVCGVLYWDSSHKRICM